MSARLASSLSIVLACAIVAVAACDDGVKADEGDDAMMQVSGAQFFRGPIPAENGGPGVEIVTLQTNTVFVGREGKPMKGTLDATAKSAAIALRDDTGYFIVQAGAATFDTPGKPSLAAVLSFSKKLTVGSHDLIVAAVDGAGRFGAPSITNLNAVDLDAPQGRLVFTLTWDTESDLDIHVVDPNGIEIYKGNINSYEKPPPGSPPDASAYTYGGILDVDSNANCVIDGRRQEDVAWQHDPPSGMYTVRVDTFSLCDAAYANWEVVATLDGQVVGRARGESTDTDVEQPHDRGAGVLALELMVP